MPFRADRLAALQRAHGYSNRHLAGIIGVNENTVRRWLVDGQQPGALSLNQLAATLDTNIDYLMGNTDDKTPPPSELGELSEMERRLLWAFRRGGPKGARRLLSDVDE
jgi:transcriptional regulator with XRE-family HTH domain